MIIQVEARIFPVFPAFKFFDKFSKRQSEGSEDVPHHKYLSYKVAGTEEPSIVSRPARLWRVQ